MHGKFSLPLAAAEVPARPENFDFTFGAAVNRVHDWIQGGIRLLPNIIVGLIVWAIFYGVGILVRRLIVRQFNQRKRDNLGEVLGGFVKAAISVLGFLVAATIVLPGLKPGDLIAGLGVSSVAIGLPSRISCKTGLPAC